MLTSFIKRFYKETHKLSDTHYLYTLFLLLVASALILVISIRLLVGNVIIDKNSISFFGKLKPSLSKAYEFNNPSDGTNNLVILPEWQPQTQISIWLYRPNKTAEVFDFTELTAERAIVLKKAASGTYRLSIKNGSGSEVDYNIKITVTGSSTSNVLLR
jgi:hypothetical protein